VQYRVEELAAAAGVRVDTVRFYQSRGLLPPPRRESRVAIYSDDHLTRLKSIRRYQSQGLPLAVIKRLLGSRRRSAADALLSAVADQSGEHLLSRAQVAAEVGVPEALVAAVESAGLLRSTTVDGEARYAAADVQLMRAGMELVAHGLPLDQLFQLAARHAKNIEEVTDAAIELFDRSVRGSAAEERDPEAVAATFRRLLPAVTTMVALHFQSTLVRRALHRLAERGETEALETARAVVESGRLEVTWR
jgi:DNA-binding transcriptional MerR regulator